ncbi:MAG TPA: hypothetical protein VIN09_00580 [Chloroflexota bacterium]
MLRLNVRAAFLGEPTASQEGIEAEDATEAVVLKVRGGQVVLLLRPGAPEGSLLDHCEWLRGELHLENGRVLVFEIHDGAEGAFFEDESLLLHYRRARSATPDLWRPVAKEIEP